MIAPVLGSPGDIIFPKLNEETDMITFDTIASDLLKYLGMKADVCASEDEARSKALMLSDSPESYPVYFFESDTSGEKPYEEFFTDNEVINNDTFINLGIIKNSVRRDIREVDAIIEGLRSLFSTASVTKAAIVENLKTLLPNFEHIEKGKGLDSKM